MRDSGAMVDEPVRARLSQEQSSNGSGNVIRDEISARHGCARVRQTQMAGKPWEHDPNIN